MSKLMLGLSIVLAVLSGLTYLSFKGMLFISLMSPEILIVTILLMSIVFILINMRSLSPKIS
jgi:hypothetical protein